MCVPRTNGEVCTLNQPTVNSRNPVPVTLQLEPGETIVVDAGGCVQTGGRGKTWKRYVDPQGPGSDRLYHGLIQIPGVHAALTRLSGVVGKQFTIPVTPATRGVLLLLIGYEDDNFDDNGYGNRNGDDGVNDQCKNLPDAFIKLTITYARPGTPTAAPVFRPPTLPLDLVPNDGQQQFDDNGLLLDPLWGAQVGNTATSVRDVNATCPGLRFSPGCTSQRVGADVRTDATSFVDGLFDAAGFLAGAGLMSLSPGGVLSVPSGPLLAYLTSTNQAPFLSNSQICPDFGGHENWFAATFTGQLRFSDLSDSDNDLNFILSPYKDSVSPSKDSRFPLIGGANSIVAEIDSNEIPYGLELWGPWVAAEQLSRGELFEVMGNAGSGTTFSELVAGAPKAINDFAVPMKQDTMTDAVVTGLFGLDCVHDCQTELHPAYAIAFRADASHWHYLIRNFGDEGFCSNEMHWLNDTTDDSTTFTIRLPHESRSIGSVHFQSTAADQTIAFGKDANGPFVTVTAPELAGRTRFIVAGSIEMNAQ